MKKIFILILLFLFNLSFSQNVIMPKTKTYFGSDSVTITNSETVVSSERIISRARSWDTRVTVLFDTTSGTTKTYFDFLYRVAESGDSLRDWKYITVDSFFVADDHTTQTYNLNDFSIFPQLRSAFSRYMIRFRQTGTQVNRIKVFGYEYDPD